MSEQSVFTSWRENQEKSPRHQNKIRIREKLQNKIRHLLANINMHSCMLEEET